MATNDLTPGWTQLEIASGPSAREDHTWTVAGDDRVAYLFGGRAQGGPSDELWQFDLAAATWSQVEPTNSGPEARFGHTATWVPEIGLVIWSGQGRAGFFDDIWRYDPASSQWEELPSSGAAPSARYGSCASLGPDGELWISHGFTADSGRFSDTRSYNFSTGSWTDRTPRDRVPVKRCLHDCFWSSGGQLILYGGQTTGVPALGDLWSLDLARGTWTQASDPPAPPRQLYSLAIVPGGGVVFGGGSVDGGFLSDMWFLDPAELQMSPMDVLGTSPPERSGATLIDGGPRALLFGGQDSEGLLGDTWALAGALDP
jgi:hypothetical protein